MPMLNAEQVFLAFPRFCVDAFGVDEADCNFDFDNNFVGWMESLSFFEEVDFDDLIWRWQREFGMSASQSDFDEFMRGGIPRHQLTPERWEREIKPTLTFRRLCQWIADRVEMPSFSPVNIAGRNCGPAGAFFGIAAAVDGVVPECRFSPSSEILHHVQGRNLASFWNRLRLYGYQRLPDLVFPYFRLGCATVLVALLTFAIGLISIGRFGRIEQVPILAIGCAAVFMIGLKAMHSGNPLPSHIKTFRDLAYAMSAIMNGPDPKRASPVRSLS